MKTEKPATLVSRPHFGPQEHPRLAQILRHPPSSARSTNQFKDDGLVAAKATPRQPQATPRKKKKS